MGVLGTLAGVAMALGDFRGDRFGSAVAEDANRVDIAQQDLLVSHRFPCLGDRDHEVQVNNIAAQFADRFK